jgi:hypothetical protein
MIFSVSNTGNTETGIRDSQYRYRQNFGGITGIITLSGDMAHKNF